MSKPMTRSNPACPDVRAMPTTPPAGPDSTASLPRKCAASRSPPLDCMNISRTDSSSPATSSTYRRRIGERYASTTVVSPRGTSLISGLTSCEQLTWVKPASRAAAATAVSWAG